MAMVMMEMVMAWLDLNFGFGFIDSLALLRLCFELTSKAYVSVASGA